MNRSGHQQLVRFVVLVQEAALALGGTLARVVVTEHPELAGEGPPQVVVEIRDHCYMGRQSVELLVQMPGVPQSTA